tara:strand:- start:3371 stop:4333 length:963 start_codon:yes stop_codon:yes gene_type:complete
MIKIRMAIGIFLFTAALATTAESHSLITVAKDGSGDYTSIQPAINASKAFPDQRITIKVKNGVYKEKLEIYSWNTKISLIGESKEATIVTYDDYFGKIRYGRNSTFHTYTVKISGNDAYLRDLTIVNSSGPVGQAVALHIEADRVYLDNIAIKGFQDTVYLGGEGHRSYFKNCYIEGSVDFIFGAGTALFENCEIKSLSNGFITAASTPIDQEFGLTFKYCRLTALPSVKQAYLGRPWRRYARTAFINSELGAHIHPDGWHNWDNTQNEKTAFYAEYGNVGAGKYSTARVKWARQLGRESAAKYTAAKIFRNWNYQATMQ